MRRLRVVGLCLIVVFAFGAVVSASASAGTEPALWECAKAATIKVGTIKKYVGEYTDKHCSIAATTKQKEEGLVNKYGPFQEWNLAAKKGKAKVFTGEGYKHGGANLVIAGVGGLSCATVKDTGEFTGPKSAGNVVATFTGCELLHHQCETGVTLGEIKTNPLKGEIGYINASLHQVGVLLSPEGTYATTGLHCAEIALRTSGGVIGEVVSKQNVYTTEATLNFEQAAGIQARRTLEGFPGEYNLGTEKASWPEEEEWNGPYESGESGKVKGKGEELVLKA
ncbi:MAG TPA: hypothetical protein VES65_04930 [Solirubrobacteraceae bacterium]|nr:hypothetical protein [Solirubrobacteraceae bacterium]